MVYLSIYNNIVCRTVTNYKENVNKNINRNGVGINSKIVYPSVLYNSKKSENYKNEYSPITKNYMNTFNTSFKNTGLKNTTFKNTAFKNTGLKNTGLKNTGLKNTGLKNTGLNPLI